MKKLTPKEIRQQNEARRKAIIEEKARKREEQLAEKQPEPVTDAKSAETGKEKKQKNKKTASKRAGVKSAFVSGNGRLILTTFGKGNDAVIEKVVTGNKVSDIQTPENYTAKAEAENIEVTSYSTGSAVTGHLSDPRHINTEKIRASEFQKGRVSGKDMIGIKPFLEKKYFGKEYEDNIHVQIAYSIMDIEKILAPHINNIVYTIDNLFRKEGLESDDFQGYMSLRNTFKQFLAESMDKTLPDDINERKREEKRRSNEINKRGQFEALMKAPQRAYLGKALWGDSGIISDIYSDDENVRAELKRYYYELCLIGMSRQCLFHGESYDGLMYTLDPKYDDPSKEDAEARREARLMLDKLFEGAVNKINEDFCSNAGHDIATLFRIFNARNDSEKAEIAKAYYDFIVFRQQKNTGFSIRKIREAMFLCDAAVKEYREPETGMKKKFYRNVDFLIYRYYMQNPDRGEKMVRDLRFLAKKEEDKDELYRKEGEFLWQELKSAIIGELLPLAKAYEFALIKPLDKQEVKSLVAGKTIDSSASYFSKLIFMFTLFINGKEINDILTQLQSKFENIAAFLCVLRLSGMEDSFTERFAIFSENSSQTIAAELRLINNIARQANADDAIPYVAYSEALQVLGFSGTKADIDNYVAYITSSDFAPQDYYKEKDEWYGRIKQIIAYDDKSGNISIQIKAQNIVNETYDLKDNLPYEMHIDNLRRICNEAEVEGHTADRIVEFISKKDGSLKGKYRKLLKAAEYRLPDQGFRNFIINNVIKSRNFIYLVRFTNPASISGVINNTVLVRFVLSQISVDQIKRYYESIKGIRVSLPEDKDERKKKVGSMRKELLFEVQKVNVNTFINVNQKANAEEDEDKNKALKLLGLYLAVLYLAAKNLVNVNARYCMAFHRIERDCLPITGKKYSEDNMCRITKLAISEDAPRLNKHACKYIKENLGCADKNLLVQYRNIVMHLNAVRNFSAYAEGVKDVKSYYALYQYVIQKALIAKYNGLSSVFDYGVYKDYRERFEKHGSYVKDFVKVLNVPFAYNLPRYKNLSIEGLFDRNNPGEKGEIKLTGE